MGRVCVFVVSVASVASGLAMVSALRGFYASLVWRQFSGLLKRSDSAAFRGALIQYRCFRRVSGGSAGLDVVDHEGVALGVSNACERDCGRSIIK